MREPTPEELARRREDSAAKSCSGSPAAKEGGQAPTPEPPYGAMEAEQPQPEATQQESGMTCAAPPADAENDMQDNALEPEEEGFSSAEEEVQRDGQPDREGSHADEEAAVRSKNLIPITLEMLSKGGYYDMPMSKVAHLLGRTEGSFQRVCRGLGILRWPYRVRKSLQAIMEKTEQYLDDDAQEDGMSKAEVLRVLRGHMNDIKGISGSGMDKATKQYRQYIFKVNHKLSRKAAKMGDATVADNPKVRGMLRAASKIQKRKHPEADADGIVRRTSQGWRQGSTAVGSPSGRGTRNSGTIDFMHNSSSSPDDSEERALSPGRSPLKGGRGQNPGKPSQPTRPTPRHFRDLPASLAFEPLGKEKAGPSNIVGRMATSAAVQNRLHSGSLEDYRRLCMQEDEELLKLCLQMDRHLDAAQKALAAQGPSYPPRFSPLANPGLMYQHYGQPAMGMRMHGFPNPPNPMPGTQPHAFWPQ